MPEHDKYWIRFMKLLRLIIFLGVCLGVISQSLWASSAAPPKIGLALSGGGARGAAHVGVLKVIEELGITVDYVAGTSMGAIVGALFAAGYSAAEIEELMAQTDWSEALTDRPHRREHTMRQKDLESEFMIPHKMGFNKGEVQFPLGVVEGQHLDQIFQRLFLPVRGIRDFDDLDIPFRAVATDLVTGDEVVMSSGSLPDALRASMSVPGIFAPVRLDGRMLVDGGMSNNLPISVVRDMGAEIVIAIDISSPMLKAEELNSVLNVSLQMTNFLTRKNTEVQLAMLSDRDVLLVPDLEGASSTAFDKFEPIIGMGYESADANRSQLAALSYQTATAEPGSDKGEPMSERELGDYMVSFVLLDNESALSDELIMSRLELEIGQALDVDLLETNLDQVYSLDVFETVTYDLVTDEHGETGVRVTALPRAWGPNYLQVGLEFSDDFSGNSDFKIGMAYTRNALNSLGGELRVQAAFGREEELSFDFYQPIDREARWFIEPQVFANRQKYNVFIDETLLSVLEIKGVGGIMGLGRNFNSRNLIRMDYEYFRGDADETSGVLPFPLDDNVDIGDLTLQFQHDSQDSFAFPTEGHQHRIGYLYADKSLGAAFDYQQAWATGLFAFTRGKNTAVIHYEAGYSFQDRAPVERWWRLGGFGRLSGLIPNQLSGRHMGLVTLGYYRRLNDIKILPVYAGISLEAGNTWNFADDIDIDDLRTSGSLFVGAETPVGPVYLSWGHASNGDNTIYFYLGRPFSIRRF
jgi:NTE family protein